MSKQNLSYEKIEPVEKELKVNLPVEAAFKLFTEGIGKWWPLSTHSVGRDQAESCYFEGWVGGRIIEVMKNGNQAEWGRVLVWEPHNKVAFQWYPERTPETAQEVMVTFSEIAGGSLVHLIHTGWETLGDQAITKRDGYVTGWDFVLGKFTEFAQSL